MITKIKPLQIMWRKELILMKESIDKVSQYLTKNSIKPSYPRIKIFQYLEENHSHPTVDEIYNTLVKEIPTLSKTTVYNTLNILINAGVARVLTIEGNETRYDVDMKEHGHFKCESCGDIIDFTIETDKLNVMELKDFKINVKSIYYKGICNECLKYKKEKLEEE